MHAATVLMKAAKERLAVPKKWLACNYNFKFNRLASENEAQLGALAQQLLFFFFFA